MEQNCNTCEDMCVNCFDYSAWRPKLDATATKEKEMEEHVSEELAKKLAGNISIDFDTISKEIEVMIGMTVKRWKEKGYIKEELKPCGWCGSKPEFACGTNKSVRCSKTSCSLSGFSMSVNDWQKRA